MPHNVAFHQGIHCLLNLMYNGSSDKIIQYFFEIIKEHPKIYKIDNPKFIISNEKEYSISIVQRVKIF